MARCAIQSIYTASLLFSLLPLADHSFFFRFDLYQSRLSRSRSSTSHHSNHPTSNPTTFHPFSLHNSRNNPFDNMFSHSTLNALFALVATMTLLTDCTVSGQSSHFSLLLRDDSDPLFLQQHYRLVDRRLPSLVARSWAEHDDPPLSSRIPKANRSPFRRLLRLRARRIRS